MSLDVAEDILHVPIPSEACSDLLIWPHNREGVLTVKLVYHNLQQKQDVEPRPLTDAESRREELNP